MIDLTPLDVRKKRGDFARTLRGYDPAAVDEFLEMVAERMEELARENHALAQRAGQAMEQLTGYRQREQAVNEALVSAQQLREELRAQADREAELVLREARAEAERVLGEARLDAERVAGDAHRQAEIAHAAARRVHQARARFVRGFRAFVERQLEEIEAEEERLRQMARPAPDAAAAPERPAAGGS